MRWTDQENQIIINNLTLGSKVIADLIFNDTGRKRTYRAVRAQSNRLGVSITNTGKFKKKLGKWKAPNGKWRTRVNGKTITLGRDGLDDNQVKLSDGRVVSRSELLRLNRMGHNNISDPVIKSTVEHVATLDERVFRLKKSLEDCSE